MSPVLEFIILKNRLKRNKPHQRLSAATGWRSVPQKRDFRSASLEAKKFSSEEFEHFWDAGSPAPAIIGSVTGSHLFYEPRVFAVNN
jgi:hypothetical protein